MKTISRRKHLRAINWLSLLVISMAFLPASRVIAEAAAWQPIGPGGGHITDLALSPAFASDNLLFAARDDLYRSTNRGNSWAIPSLTSIFEENSGVSALGISPNYTTDKTILIGTGAGIYRSVDGGVSATSVSDSSIDVRDIVISPNFASDRTAFAASQSSGIYRTTNSGASWVPANSGIPTNVRSVAVFAMSPNYASDTTVFASTWGGGFYRSTNGGSTWQAVNSGLGSPTYAFWVAISPGYATDRTVFAITDGLYRSTNGGASWSKIPSVGAGSLSRVIVSPNYVQDQTLLVVQIGYLLRSRDGGATWTQLPINLGDPAQYASGNVVFSPHYATDQMVFAWGEGIHGVWRSNDGGTTWNSINVGLNATAVYDLIASPNYATDGTIVALAEGDLWMTSAFTGVWTQKLAGGVLGVAEAVFSPSYQADQIIFALNGGISRSQDGGETWAPLSNLPEPLLTISHDYSNLLLSPTYATDRTLFVVMNDYIGDDTGLYRSVNDGATWQRLTLPGTSFVEAADIAPTYAHEPLLIAGVYGDGIYRSADGGASWERIYTLQNVINGDMSTIRFSPDFASDRTVLAGTADGVLRSTDGGLTWQNLGFNNVASVAFSPDYRTTGSFYVSEIPGRLYGGGTGVYQTTDRGGSFTQVGSNLGSRYITDLVVLPVQPEAVLAATGGSGIWALGDIGACSYPEPVALQQQIHGLQNASQAGLDRVLAIGDQAAYHGDYFARELEAAKVQLVADVLFDTIGIVADYKSVKPVIDSTKLAFPGVQSVGWQHVLELKNQFKVADQALPSVGFTPVLSNFAATGRTILQQPKTFLAWAADEAVTDLSIDRGKEIQSDIARGIQGGIHTSLYHPLPELSQIYSDKIRATGQTLGNSRLCLEPALQQLYVEDLVRREQAQTIVRSGLELQAQTLARAQSDTEAAKNDWLREFALEFLAKFLVMAAFDGPGLIALGTVQLLRHAYNNVQTLNTNQQMVTSSIELLSGVINEQHRLYSNTVSAYELIRQRKTPLIPLQTLVGIQDESFAYGINIGGQQIRPFEHTSQTVVTLTNQHDFPITFEGYARYEIEPGWWQNPVSQITKYAVTVPPYQQGQMIFSYLYEGNGKSPRQGSEISIQIVGATDTGLYPIYSSGHVWSPSMKQQLGRQNGAVTAAVDDPLLYPLRTFVTTERNQLIYQPALVIENPFPQVVTMRAVQPLPSGASVLNAGGSTQNPTSLVWERSLAPGETVVLSHTITYAGTPGAEVLYPPAVLHITDPSSQLDATFDGFGTTFAVRAPLRGQFDLPSQVVTGQTFPLTGLIRNLADVSKTGTITIATYDQNGVLIEQIQQDVTVSAQSEQLLDLSFHAPAQVGVLSVVGTLNVDGAQVPLVAGVIDVDQAQVLLPLIVRP